MTPVGCSKPKNGVTHTTHLPDRLIVLLVHEYVAVVIVVVAVAPVIVTVAVVSLQNVAVTNRVAVMFA